MPLIDDTIRNLQSQIGQLRNENYDLRRENERLKAELNRYKVPGTMHMSREEFEGQSEKGIEMPRDLLAELNRQGLQKDPVAAKARS